MTNKHKVVLDANFYIYVLQENYTNFDVVGDACKRLGYELYTTTDVWQEIRMQFMRTKSKPYMKDWIDLSDHASAFVDFQNQAKHRLRSLPQIPDLGLVFAADQLGSGDVRLVSSDYKLLDCIPYLAPNVRGMADSVFALELHEKESDSKKKTKIYRIYEEIYSKEIEYSLARKEIYFPLNKIRLITDQAINVVRQVHSSQATPSIFPPQEELVDLGPGVLLLKSLESIRERGSFVENIEAGLYDVVINEIDELQQRIDADLAIYLLTLDPPAYSSLVHQVSADLVLFRYFSALSRLYRGRAGDIEKALAEIEKGIEILKYTGNPSLDLRITVHFLQTILLILNEKFERAEQYFALLQSKAAEWGFETELRSSEGIYLALIALRGYESAEIPPLQEPQLVTTFLLDLARYQFADADFEQTLQVLQQVVAVSKKYELQEPLIESLRALMLVYYASPDTKDLAFSIMEEVVQIHQVRSWNNPFVKKAWDELSKPQRPLYRLQKKRFTPLEHLPAKIKNASMEVFCVEDISEDDAFHIFVRNWEIGANLGIFVGHQQNPPNVTAGDRIQLGVGKYRCITPKRDIEKKHATRLWIIPSPDGQSEILTGGKSGFRVFRVIGTEETEGDL